MELYQMEYDNSRIQPYKKWICINVPIWLLRQKEVSSGAKLLYGRILMFIGKNEFCFPSQKKLAFELQVSKKTISRYINELKNLKLIEVVNRGESKTSIYYVLNHIWQHSERGSYPHSIYGIG
ncbi:MAG: helix-turn-helix domain-containing protein [Ignavibacteriae bacterium]|nr:helix-turn-helix domain-containing protein [Ignavibacteriota bacterium]